MKRIIKDIMEEEEFLFEWDWTDQGARSFVRTLLMNGIL